MTAPDLSQLKIERTESHAPARQPRRRRWWRIAAVAIVLAAAALAGLRVAGQPEVETATVAQAWPAQNYTLLNATGYVVAQRKAALSSKATGRLVWLGVLEGSRVREGEVVARLESRDVEAALGQAAANAQVAEANLRQGEAELRDAEQPRRRAEELLGQHFIAAATHDAAVARFDKARAAVAAQRAAIAAARANVRAAQVAVDQTVIRAPFDGVVLTKSANVGDNITPFSSAAESKGAVVTIADMATLEVEADVAESSLARIRVDQPAEIQLDAFPGLRLAGVVSRMVPTLDRSKATLLVKVRFVDRDPRVLPDMSARVAFLSRPVPPDERAPVAALQPAAVVQRDGKPVVFALRDGQVRQTPVTTGRRVGELLAVRGVAVGTKVVLRPPPSLRDGQRVKPVQP
ncbi:RND family efflux transporter MFP subunit [Pseudoduganella flava]|uniref:Efflux RND transporter periplasmic adaptor subunit n=1 Tax=Pseudoduganella flava TaxID=871742 RepID=A0A562PEW5_9BURK|nr:efflux RND transporter periplasmic adaptor subunit [Pseudoduganella flava]QGZ38900.1 efflux RND transporter periplasmic adaptor subunit [Pseudoduganella flava]TWI42971.1 RND family efflux transporter MFP subunit [Pseudoduganella flava]